MHMNSAPHLLNEDRAEFERILDETLRHAHDRPDLADVGKRLTAEQLRTMALHATSLITATAADEYEYYTKVREEFRHPAPPSADSVSAPSVAGATETGAGLAAIVAVLVPILAAAAAVVFLCVGYVLRMLSPVPAFSATLLTVGWFFGAVTAVGLAVAAAGLLITALRNGATQVTADASDPAWPDEVAGAREAWREAVLVRGLLPFLRDALAAPAVKPAPKARPAQHLPKMGYSRPNFSSPGDGAPAGRRPSYSSPDFSSPDYGGPEHHPE
ncbi:hypothetical protein OG875_15315 [Streptomyces sp. NBC_01498]|uniref:hypothetical protein n=1 Tax=Streptomyces sp. NBC_01498 TaxID=2975870 RepID=UPI002E7B1349|nr:hypothetical protein [Streptomyces sp. NBC_01498]WTL25849.1 hypothetical protein OG875_15315 [Streptomyces sp. NBC_01498]